MNENYGHELGWDDEIEGDGIEFEILPAGIYDFVVTALERSRYQPKEDAKIPACDMAIISLRIDTGKIATTVKDRLYLHSSRDRFIGNFFVAIGLKKKGEKSPMRWRDVVGSRGKAKIGIDKWVGNDGREHENNTVDYYIEPQTANPSSPQPIPPQRSYEVGKY